MPTLIHGRVQRSVDATPVSLATILSQVDPKTEESHVNTYTSRALTATEQQYSREERPHQVCNGTRVP